MVIIIFVSCGVPEAGGAASDGGDNGGAADGSWS